MPGRSANKTFRSIGRLGGGFLSIDMMVTYGSISLEQSLALHTQRQVLPQRDAKRSERRTLCIGMEE